MMHRTLGARQIPQYHGWLIQHTRIFMHRLVNDPAVVLPQFGPAWLKPLTKPLN